MKRQLSKAARQEVVLAVRERYRQASGPDQQRILNEFVAVTGYHRKHAIRVLALNISGSQAQRQARPRLYDEAVREALILLWEASDRVCGKRLAALVPILIESLERHGHLQLDLTVRFRLLSASPATIDRLLAPARAAVRGLIRRRNRQAPYCVEAFRLGPSRIGAIQNLVFWKPISSRTAGEIWAGVSCIRLCSRTSPQVGPNVLPWS